jgi:hypothetical protein
MIFRQIVGRFVRTISGRPQEPSWLYVPADPVLRDHASTIEQEVRRSLRRPGEEDLAALDEPVERRETERMPALDFEALSADVAPQMTLFGGPAAAPPPPPPPPPPPAAARWLTPDAKPAPSEATAAGPPPASDPGSVPAFERRARMRDQRHQLVSELRHRDGTSHREINAWLNRKLGIASVEKATLAQLEQSIELLYGRLSRRAA